VSFKVYIEADGPLEEKIMATLNELLARLDATGAKAEAEHAQVVAAVTDLKSEIASLREIIQNQPLPELDLAEAFAKLDVIDAKIDGIYTPDEPPPAPPAGPGE
jgi:hypothetical protein